MTDEITEQEQHNPMRFTVGVMLTLACASLWGASHVIGKHVISSEADPLFVVAGRNAVSGIVILFISLVLAFRSEDSYKIEFTRSSIVMIAGRSVSGLFYFMSFAFLSATQAITLYKLNPLYTLAILLLVFPRSLTGLSVLRVGIGVVLAITGSILAALSSQQSVTQFNDVPAVGIVYMVIAGVFWSAFVVSSESHTSSRIEGTRFWHRQRYVAYVYLLSSLPFAGWLVVKLLLVPELMNELRIDLEAVTQVCVLGGISGVIGTLYFEAIKRISSLLVSVIVSLEVFVTLMLEAIFLNHPITSLAILGAVTVITGAIVVSFETKRVRGTTKT